MNTSNGTKTYQVDKHKQLIPLNGSMVNFFCFFEVKSKDKKPFNLAIVEQSETKPKQFKLVEDGYINGQLDSDGQLKTYFLVLKAPQPCECDVRVIVKPKENESQQHSSSQGIHPPSQFNTPEMQPPHFGAQQPQQPQNPIDGVVVNQGESFFQLKYIIGISVAIIIIFLLFKYRKTIFEKFKEKNTLIPSVSNISF